VYLPRETNIMHAYYDVANLVTLTKINMIRLNALWLCKSHCCENTASILPKSWVVVLAALEASHRFAQRSQVLQNLTIL
jgi:hypothetical protein